MWAGFGERSVDDMLQVWLDIVYLDDAEFKRLVDERKAHPTLTAGVQRPYGPAFHECGDLVWPRSHEVTKENTCETPRSTRRREAARQACKR